MSKDRGLDLQNGLARYLQHWWPGARSVGAGRPGTDVEGIPGVAWENKTAARFEPLAFVRQARWHVQNSTDVPIVVYWPQGVGEQSADSTLAFTPLAFMVQLLLDAGYGPAAGKDKTDAV